MSTKIALLCMGLLLTGWQGLAVASAADEHERGGQEGRQAGAARGPEGGPGRQAGPGQGPNRGPVGARPSFDGRGQVLDSRYNHGRYYPPRGAYSPSLPSGYRPYFRGNDRFYFNGGIWYSPRGPGFVVVRPPSGLVISVLPPYYSTVWFGGVPYYYADDVYYSYQPDQNGYAVVDPPDNSDAPAPPPDAAQNDMMIYPKNGQSKEQQAADQFECNTWAKGQTGFDVTQPNGGVQGNADALRGNYDRAMSACLQGRGYQVY